MTTLLPLCPAEENFGCRYREGRGEQRSIADILAADAESLAKVKGGQCAVCTTCFRVLRAKGVSFKSCA